MTAAEGEGAGEAPDADDYGAARFAELLRRFWERGERAAGEPRPGAGPADGEGG